MTTILFWMTKVNSLEDDPEFYQPHCKVSEPKGSMARSKGSAVITPRRGGCLAILIVIFTQLSH